MRIYCRSRKRGRPERRRARGQKVGRRWAWEVCVGALYIRLQIPSHVKRCVHKMAGRRAYIPTFSTPVPFPPQLDLSIHSTLDLPLTVLLLNPHIPTHVNAHRLPIPSAASRPPLPLARLLSRVVLSLPPSTTSPNLTSLLSTIRPLCRRHPLPLLAFHWSLGRGAISLSKSHIHICHPHTPSIPRDLN